MISIMSVACDRSLRSLRSRVIRVRTFNTSVYLFLTALIASILEDHRVGHNLFNFNLIMEALVNANCAHQLIRRPKKLKMAAIVPKNPTFIADDCAASLITKLRMCDAQSTYGTGALMPLVFKYLPINGCTPCLAPLMTIALSYAWPLIMFTSNPSSCNCFKIIRVNSSSVSFVIDINPLNISFTTTDVANGYPPNNQWYIISPRNIACSINN